ncbi:MAG: Flp pilus assembly protein CpaB [Chloroflexota bacterium]|nr:Flp pilus assembly protein CpaB [Chloroflexota bacterium]
MRQPRRLDLRAVVGLAVMLGAVAASMMFWSASSDTRKVLVATHDLAAGAVLQPSDLAVSDVRVDDQLYNAALAADSLSSTLGKQLSAPVQAHQMLSRAQLSGKPPLAANQLALTIPVTPASAVAGRVQPGDDVQIVSTTDKTKPTSKTTVVLPRVRVYDVSYDDRTTAVNTSTASGDSGAARGTISTVTVILQADQVTTLASARWNGDLDVALLPPQQADSQ